MKKVISTVSVFLLLSTGACRSGNDDVNLSTISRVEHSPPAYFQRDSVTEANGGKDQEPPRKDLQQWKLLP